MKVLHHHKWPLRRTWLVVFVLLAVNPSANATPCDRLLKLKLLNTTLRLAKPESNNSFKPGVIKAPGPPLDDLPDFCRVAGEIHPTSESKIRFEVWMPVSGWNGRFMGVGNGGWSGEIWYPSMGVALRKGYATASTDTGHVGSFEDAGFAFGHPEKVIDFGYRAVHELTIVAKAIVAAYYGDPPKFSYWQGCSSGGKQGLKEAQRFPEDYDGIIAGAPANDWVHFNASGVWIWQANHQGAIPILTEDKLLTLHRAAVKACDSSDGLGDSIIGLPRSCHFRPEASVCEGRAGPECLTSTEILAANKIYGGPKNPRTGKAVFPGLEPGSELGWGIWSGAPEPPASYFRFVVFQNPNWDARTLDFDRDVSLADKLDHGIIAANDSNLSQFFGHGGKLILYHGLTDPLIAPQNTIDYYNNVLSIGGDVAERSMRLFLAPGMNHCGGGEGPNVFDFSDALVEWTEHNINVREVVAAHFGDSQTAKEPDRTRPLCAYPKVAKYLGVGSIDQASSFSCQSQ